MIGVDLQDVVSVQHQNDFGIGQLGQIYTTHDSARRGLRTQVKHEGQHSWHHRRACPGDLDPDGTMPEVDG
jgi:hypothetical protein